jgi:undecaprenyl-diphosphatase
MTQLASGASPDPEHVTGRKRWYPPWPALAALRRAELLRARWTLLLAAGVLAIGAFLKLTSELHEGELDALDRTLLEAVVAARVAALNGTAVDVTALGSVTVVSGVCVLALGLYALSAQWRAFWQLALAAIGGGLCSTALKQVLERARPNAALRLVQVESFSYPSGHSLAAASVYLTLALLVARPLPNRGARLWVFAFALTLIAAVGASRAYLGVHYPSDILAGLLLGSGYSLLVSAVFSYLQAKTNT